jgi:hypothetical protein
MNTKIFPAVIPCGLLHDVLPEIAFCKAYIRLECAAKPSQNPLSRGKSAFLRWDRRSVAGSAQTQHLILMTGEALENFFGTPEKADKIPVGAT